jgi:hypothetical protein
VQYLRACLLPSTCRTILLHTLHVAYALVSHRLPYTLPVTCRTFLSHATHVARFASPTRWPSPAPLHATHVARYLLHVSTARDIRPRYFARSTRCLVTCRTFLSHAIHAARFASPTRWPSPAPLHALHAARYLLHVSAARDTHCVHAGRHLLHTRCPLSVACGCRALHTRYSFNASDLVLDVAVVFWVSIYSLHRFPTGIYIYMINNATTSPT